MRVDCSSPYLVETILPFQLLGCGTRPGGKPEKVKGELFSNPTMDIHLYCAY